MDHGLAIPAKTYAYLVLTMPKFGKKKVGKEELREIFHRGFKYISVCTAAWRKVNTKSMASICHPLIIACQVLVRFSGTDKTGHHLRHYSF